MDLAKAGKKELRALCKEYGVKNYGNMNNEMMRDAVLATIAPLEVIKPEQVAVEPEATLEQAVAAIDNGFNPFGSLAKQVVAKEVPVAIKSVEAKFVEVEVIKGPKLSCKGLKIQKERVTQNGITKRSEGTLCYKIWQFFDENLEIRAADLKDVADSNKWDKTTVHVQFYAWRKFNGIVGRQ